MSAENTTVTQVFLGIIAISTLVTAVMQVAFILYGVALVRRLSRILDQLEQEMKPVLAGLNAVARDAARASALAVVQVERVDRLFTDVTARIEETAATVHRTIITPLREGAALMATIRAVLAIVKDLISRPRSASADAASDGDGGPAAPSVNDEDPLFIG
jgi:hypothetical protein